jgi:hypothetical protein
MNLRDVLVRPGIVDSPRLCALSLAVQLFFRNLLHTCDGAGRFIADADDLRDTLYRHARDRVSRRHITSWLQSCHHAGLVRLYTGPDGRGYGEVLKYGQRDKNRRVIHPAREDASLNFEAPPAADPPDPPPQTSEVNRRECECSTAPDEIPPPAPQRASGAHTHTPEKKTPEENLSDALARLGKKHPALDLKAEIARAEAYVKKLRGPTARLTLYFFENNWLPKSGGPALSATAPIAHIPAEPEYWRELLNDEFPQSVYSRGGAEEGRPWAELPRHVRDLVLTNLPRWLRATGRSAA